MNDTSGPTSERQFATYDPDTHSWKMWPATGLWGSIEYSETWPKTGCMSDGRAFERPTLVPRITESDCSSLSHLPTPKVSGDRTSHRAATLSHSRSGPSLEQATELMRGHLPREFTSWDELPPSWHRPARTFPTPTASLGEHRNDSGQNPDKRREGGHQASLADVTCYLPTPTASEIKRDSSSPSQMVRNSPSLAVVDRHFPTPEAKNGSAGPDYARANRTNSGADDLVTAVDRLSRSTGDHTETLFDVGNE